MDFADRLIDSISLLSLLTSIISCSVNEILQAHLISVRFWYICKNECFLVGGKSRPGAKKGSATIHTLFYETRYKCFETQITFLIDMKEQLLHVTTLSMCFICYDHLPNVSNLQLCKMRMETAWVRFSRYAIFIATSCKCFFFPQFVTRRLIIKSANV